MADKEFIESVIKAREESVAFFSNGGKQERERWVVSAFLDNLGIVHSDSDICSSSDDPPDVVYADGNFEVKEIMDPGRRRHTEYKQSLQRAKCATAAADLLESFTPKDISYTEICTRVEAAMKDLPLYDPKVKATVDLLFYVNLQHVTGYVATELTAAKRFEHYEWRSISFVAGLMAVVLHASSDAPSFLRASVGKVVRQPPH